MRFIFPFIALLFCFTATAQIDPATVPSLELWVRADVGVQYFGATVLNWFDQSGNDNNMTQPVTNRRPVIASGELNGFDVMRFDGTTDYMDFPAINSIRTVFWVVKENEGATDTYRGLLGHSDTYHFIRGAGKLFWNETFTHPGIQNGITRVVGEEVDGLNTIVPTGFKVMSLVTSEPVEANRFSRDRNSSASVWDGDLAQLLIFSDSLSNEQISGVEEYLYNYYTPPLDLGPDIILADNFCDTLLVASEGYVNYTWSDGSSNDSLLVNSSGTFWVDATDVFGRVIRDTVLVEYPGNPVPDNTLICSGETFTWDTGLDAEIYEITWQDNSTNATFSVDQDSTLQVTITDSYGCVFSPSPVQVTVDDYADIMSLGDDLSLCVGQSFGLVSGNFPGISYLWSDGSEEADFLFAGQPEVWVEVSNLNNCIARDTLMLNSLGNAPNVSFSFDATCFTDNTIFLDQSIGDSELISWLWDFGGDGTAEGEVPSHEFSAPGNYLIQLEVADLNGCQNETELEIQIQALPIANFDSGFTCSGEETEFSDLSSSADGEITVWEWIFPEEESIEQNPTYLFDEPGFQSVTLNVESEFGCQSSSTQLVNVNPTPELNIVAEGSCLGDFTEISYEYIDNGSGFPLVQTWDFGDATSSAQPTPSHYYQIADDYNITLNVLASNGCEAVADADWSIYAPPIPLASELGFCVGVPGSPVDMSTSSGGAILQWEWEIEELGSFGGIIPELLFNEAGTYGFQLRVTTEFQCYGVYIGSMNAYDNPIVEASFSPDIGQAPFEVEFQASANENCNYSWNFPGGDFLLGDEVTYTFDTQGIQTVDLIATNDYGCSADFQLEVPVQEPIMDLSLLSLERLSGTTTVLVRNDGNYRLNEIEFKQRLFSGGWSNEIWEGELMPGQLLGYQFTSELESFGRSEEILCAAAYPLSSISIDSDLSNNEGCIGFEVESIFYSPYPNPAESSVVFHFNLPSDEAVELDIYNSLGQKVWSAGAINALEGYNSIESDISNLVNGIYIVKMRYLSQEFEQYLMVE